MSYFAQAPRNARQPVAVTDPGTPQVARGGDGPGAEVGETSLWSAAGPALLVHRGGGGGGGGVAWALGGGAPSSASHARLNHGRGETSETQQTQTQQMRQQPISRTEAVRRFVEERARQDDYGEQARPGDARAGHGLHRGRWEGRAGWKQGVPAPTDDPRRRAHEGRWQERGKGLDPPSPMNSTQALPKPPTI